MLNFRYATCKELILLFIGIGVSLVTGAGLPLMSLLQGSITQAFVNEQMYKTNTTPGPFFHYNDTDFTHDVMKAVYGYTAMAIGIFLAANVQFEHSKKSTFESFVCSNIRRTFEYWNTRTTVAKECEMVTRIQFVLSAVYIGSNRMNIRPFD
ncbi:unnamed protein product [Strongylus vulgaris]|uniref:Uncharacterized protein n=1 Tax=Strongylus vulgaris TaxID=40348 RepID=A0A3P7IQD7_STRVU|nr:unnamed protein product [Strongylus vulgaris]